MPVVLIEKGEGQGDYGVTNRYSIAEKIITRFNGTLNLKLSGGEKDEIPNQDFIGMTGRNIPSSQ